MRRFWTKLVIMLLSNVMIGASIGLFRFVDLGTDPFSSMVIGISHRTGLSFGNIQCMACVLLFGMMFLWKRESIGIGTLPSIFLNGYISDFVYLLCKDSGMGTQTLVFKSFLLVLALVICTFSVAVCIEVNMGTSAYDTLPMIIEDKTKSKISFKMARIYTDSFCILVGVILGAKIGVNTLIMAVFTGLLVNYFRNLIKDFDWSVQKKVIHHKLVHVSGQK